MAQANPTPGLLFVRMNPHDDLSPEEFHDWYNNEHGPMRLRLSLIENGYRFRALDVAETKFSRYETSDTDSTKRKVSFATNATVLPSISVVARVEHALDIRVRRSSSQQEQG